MAGKFTASSLAVRVVGNEFVVRCGGSSLVDPDCTQQTANQFAVAFPDTVAGKQKLETLKAALQKALDDLKALG